MREAWKAVLSETVCVQYGIVELLDASRALRFFDFIFPLGPDLTHFIGFASRTLPVKTARVCNRLNRQSRVL